MSQYSGFVFKNDFKIASCRHGKTIQPFYQELVVDEVEIKTYQPQCTQYVAGITVIRYDQCQKIESHKIVFKAFGSLKTQDISAIGHVHSLYINQFNIYTYLPHFGDYFVYSCYKINNEIFKGMYLQLIEIKTQISNLGNTTHVWNNLHQVNSMQNDLKV